LTDNEGNRFGHRVWCDITVEVIDQSSDMSASSMIFPVLNYDQQSVSAKSTDTSVPVSSTPTTLASSEIERLQNEHDGLFRDQVSSGSSLAALKCNKKLESNFEIESQSDLYDSDDSDDNSSIASSNDSSQEDYIVVEKDSDNDVQMQRGRSVQPYIINKDSINELKPLVENVQSLSLVSSVDEIVTSRPKLSGAIPEKYQKELIYLAEMGFHDKEKNIQLLENHNGDLLKIVDVLLNKQV